MLYLVHGAENTRTIIFPNTVRETKYDAFTDNQSLRSAVLNEGLERLEGRVNEIYDKDGSYCDSDYIGVFSNSKL